MCVCLISWYFIAEIIFRDFLHFIVSKCIYHILIYLLYIYIYWVFYATAALHLSCFLTVFCKCFSLIFNYTYTHIVACTTCILLILYSCTIFLNNYFLNICSNLLYLDFEPYAQLTMLLLREKNKFYRNCIHAHDPVCTIHMYTLLYEVLFFFLVHTIYSQLSNVLYDSTLYTIHYSTPTLLYLYI